MARFWPKPGDIIQGDRDRAACSWNRPVHASGVVTLEWGERVLIIARAFNPGKHHSEEGTSPNGKRWQRTWWMALRSSGQLVWINEAQMLAFYEAMP